MCSMSTVFSTDSPEKCELHASEVLLLGFIINAQSIFMDTAKVQAVADWSVPAIRKELQWFLGFANFYRCFIPNYSSPDSSYTPETQLSGVPSC